MKFLFSSIFIFLFSISALAADIQGTFTLLDSDKKVREGDIVEGVLRIWPIENAELEIFRGLEDKILFNNFYLTDIESLGPSENNADVIEIKASFIVRGNVNLHDEVINYKGTNIRIQPPHVQVERIENNEKDYYVMEQSTTYSRSTQVFLIAIIGLLIFAIIWKRRAMLSFVEKFRNNPGTKKIRHFRDLFHRAASRQEYEEIYALRKDWLSYIENKTAAYQEFFRIMELHQYKPNWNPEEMKEVKTIFDAIRGSFK